MRYFCPNTIDEAVAILAEDEDARCLAGGATLVAMLNAELLTPSTLVSLRGIADLEGVRETKSGVTIGAMTRHAAVAADPRFTGGLEVVRLAAQEIGHPAIRAVGTIGGSIAHADPSADYPSALVAANAEIEVVGSAGTRRIGADQFFEDFFTTALLPGEMVSAIHLTNAPESNVSAYLKIARSDGDFAIVSIAFSGRFDGRTCTDARVAVGGCASTPLNVPAVDEMLVGADIGSDRIGAAADALAQACDPIDDVRGSASYRRLLVKRLLPRVLEDALAKRDR